MRMKNVNACVSAKILLIACCLIWVSGGGLFGLGSAEPPEYAKEITFYHYITAKSDFFDSLFAELVDETGISIEQQVVEYSSAKESLIIRFASGDVPDVIAVQTGLLQDSMGLDGPDYVKLQKMPEETIDRIYLKDMLLSRIRGIPGIPTACHFFTVRSAFSIARIYSIASGSRRPTRGRPWWIYATL